MRLSIRYSAAAALAIGLAAVVLAACGGGGDGSSSNAGAMGATGGIVSVRSVDNSKVLTDSQGRTLYSANVEKGGRIMCTSGCTSIWAPAGASAAQAKAAATDLNLNLGVVKRPGAGDQLTFDGKPLYSFTQEAAGQLEGNGVMDQFNGTQFTWTAATSGASQASAGSGSGPGSASSSSPY
jgi:predicted lipoprotein with Yx(FWY)xxD motif